MQDILQSEESLIALNIANSSDFRKTKKIPHFVCFSCKKMLQSEESDFNMKSMLSFLRLLVMREIPCFVGCHKNKFLRSEELNRKCSLPQIECYDRNSSLCRLFMDKILQNEESSPNLTRKPLQRKYVTVCINTYKTLTPKADFTVFLIL